MSSLWLQYSDAGILDDVNTTGSGGQAAGRQLNGAGGAGSKKLDLQLLSRAALGKVDGEGDSGQGATTVATDENGSRATTTRRGGGGGTAADTHDRGAFNRLEARAARAGAHRSTDAWGVTQGPGANPIAQGDLPATAANGATAAPAFAVFEDEEGEGGATGVREPIQLGHTLPSGRAAKVAFPRHDDGVTENQRTCEGGGGEGIGNRVDGMYGT